MKVAIILIVIVVLISYIISISNNFSRLLIKIKESDSGIDVALTKRYDLITKMVDVVKGYVKHEKETLFEIVKLRNGMSLEDKSKENAKMDQNVAKINVLAENYPNLKANENFLMLQQALVEVEEHLQAARRLYNANVSKYNQQILVFPNSIIAKIRKLKEQDFFQAEEESKNNVNINV